jgi:hypothetical protein
MVSKYSLLEASVPVARAVMTSQCMTIRTNSYYETGVKHHSPRKVVLIAESSTQSKIRINDYNNFRMYNVRRVVFDPSLLDHLPRAVPVGPAPSVRSFAPSWPMNAFTGHPPTTMKWPFAQAKACRSSNFFPKPLDSGVPLVEVKWPLTSSQTLAIDYSHSGGAWGGPLTSRIRFHEVNLHGVMVPHVGGRGHRLWRVVRSTQPLQSYQRYR